MKVKFKDSSLGLAIEFKIKWTDYKSIFDSELITVSLGIYLITLYNEMFHSLQAFISFSEKKECHLLPVTSS